MAQVCSDGNLISPQHTTANLLFLVKGVMTNERWYLTVAYLLSQHGIGILFCIGWRVEVVTTVGHFLA